MQHTGPISGISTHGEKFIATAGYDNQVVLWDATTKAAMARVFHDHLANQCTFSPCGNFLATASSDYTARLWSLPDMRLTAVLAGHDDDVEMVAFSPDGSKIASCSRDNTIGIYDTTGTRLHVLSGHEADVISVVWNGAGDELISSSDDGTIRRWNAETGAQLELIDMGGVETDTVVITATGIIYSGDDEGRISIFRDGKMTFVPAHLAGIKRLIYSAEFNLLASLSYDKTLRIFNIQDNGDLSERLSSTFPSIVWPRSGAFLNAQNMVFGTFGSTYASYNLENDEWSLKDVVADASINAVVYCPDGQQARIGDAGICTFSGGKVTDVKTLCNFLLPIGDMVLSAGQTGEIYDVVTAELVHTHRSPINCGTSFLRDGVYHAVLGTYTGEGIVLRLADDGRSITHVRDINLHSNAVKGVASDSAHIFSVSADGGAGWHRISDFEVDELFEDGHTMIANGCAALSEGKFVSVSRDLKLRIWNGTEAQIVDTPHENSIKCVACSDNGRFIATGGYFGKVCIYDVQNQAWVKEFRASASGISSITALPGEDAFACASYDGKIHTFSAVG